MIVMEAISREFRVALPWELLYADDLEEDLIKRLNEWKNNVENRGMRVNMNKAKVTISGERQKPLQKAARWPCGVCGRGVGGSPGQRAVKRLLLLLLLLGHILCLDPCNTVYCSVHMGTRRL